MSETLAINGGPKAITSDPGDAFAWPNISPEGEGAVLEVLRSGTMSGTDVTKQFEQECAEWMGTDYALGYCNGTAALRAALWACEVGLGDEIICPSITFWASCTQALSMGAAVNFADVQPDSVNIDPNDIEHRIGPRTKAIMVVHYSGYPCDMDAIMEIANRHGVKVIEDVSHAHGSLYKGKRCGTLGHAAGMSLMSGKSLAIGEGGMLVTDDLQIYERAIAYGHYARTGVATMYNPVERALSDPMLQTFAGLPMGGYKHRMHQLSSALGRIQLGRYPEQMAEIDAAMNALCDLLDEVPGLMGHRPPKDSGSTNGGWYNPFALYDADALGGVPLSRFSEALKEEGLPTGGINFPLHLHPVFHEADVLWEGKPTMIAHTDRDVRQGPGSLPVAEATPQRALSIPWFKKNRPELIEEYAAAYRKVAERVGEL
jgi:perosamine synthetase